jgi:two-component system NtrC family sensor kinase
MYCKVCADLEPSLALLYLAPNLQNLVGVVLAMKLTLKLVCVVLAVTVLVLSIAGYLRVQREVETFQSTMAQDGRLLGQIIEGMLADAWQTYGQARVLQLLEDANASTHRFHFSWIPRESLTTALDRAGVDQQQRTALLQGDRIAVKTRDAQGQATLSIYTPVVVGSEMPGVIEVVQSLAGVQSYVQKTMLETLGVGVVLVVLSGCLLLLVGLMLIGRPMRSLIEKARRVGAGDLEHPLQVRTHDELAEVARALNHMCEQLKTSQAEVRTEMEARLHTLEQLRHADRLKTVGSLASGIAHELGTPLNVVSGRANLIGSGRLSPPEVTDSVRIIKEQVQRMTRIIQQLLAFARRKSPRRVAVDLRSLVQHTLDMLKSLAEQQHAMLTLTMDSAPVLVRVDTGQIQQVLMNLVTNAWQAMPAGGEVAIAVSSTTAQPPPGLAQPAQRYACVSVTDQGIGIPADDLQYIFDPFFTTKDVGHGTGLGLSIAYGIIQDHGGWIDVCSQPGQGTRMAVYVPMEEEPWPDAS